MKRTVPWLFALVAVAFALSGCTPKPVAPAPLPPEQAAAEPQERTAALTPPEAMPAPSEKSPRGGTIRIVTWNLEWFPGGKPDATADAAALQMAGAKKVIAELNPDILLLQEVKDWQSADQLCRVVPQLHVQVVSRFPSRPQNQVMASKRPADSAWSAAWKTGPTDPPRGYSFAALELPGGRYLLTYSLHLKSNLGDLAVNRPMREESSRQLLHHVREMLALYGQRGPCAVVVAGDMNTSIDDAHFAQEQTLRAWVKAGFHWTHEGVPFSQRTTIPADERYPDNCFDHIFTLGLGQPTAAVKAVAGVSDHNPVILEVDLSKADFTPKLDLSAGEAVLGAAVREVAPTPPPADAATVATVNANDDAVIRAAVGKVIAVKGRVQNIGQNRVGSILFINFAGNPRGQFCGIVKAANQEAVSVGLGATVKAALAGKMIELRGKLELYQDTPQIEVARADQVKIMEP